MAVASIATLSPTVSAPVPVADIKGNTSADVVKAEEAVDNLATERTEPAESKTPSTTTAATPQSTNSAEQPPPVYNALATATQPAVLPRGSTLNVSA